MSTFSRFRGACRRRVPSLFPGTDQVSGVASSECSSALLSSYKGSTNQYTSGDAGSCASRSNEFLDDPLKKTGHAEYGWRSRVGSESRSYPKSMQKSSENGIEEQVHTPPHYQDVPPQYTILDPEQGTTTGQSKLELRIARGGDNRRRQNPYARATDSLAFHNLLAREKRRRFSLKSHDQSTLEGSGPGSICRGTDPAATVLSKEWDNGADESMKAGSMHFFVSEIPDESLRSQLTTGGSASLNTLHHSLPIGKNIKIVTWQGVIAEKGVWQNVTDDLLADHGMQKGAIGLGIGRVSSWFVVDWSAAVSKVFGRGFCRQTDNDGIVVTDCHYVRLMWKWDLPWSMEHEADFGISLRCEYEKEILAGTPQSKESGIFFAIKLANHSSKQRIIRNYGNAVEIS